MATMTTCIYCGKSFDAHRGEGDHILPVQLGEFRNDRRFRQACPLCNNDIGASEQQLLRCGPEALMRAIVKPAVPARRQRGGPSFSGGAMGAPAPRFTIDHGDHRSNVRPTPDDPRTVEPVDQLVLKDRVKGEVVVPLFSGMTADALKRRIEKLECDDIEDVRLHGDDRHWAEFQALVLAAFPGKRIEELPPTEAGNHRVPGRTTLVVNEHYFRALAKIGFHYYLSRTKRGVRGDEPEFAAVRQFITGGTDADVDTFFEFGPAVVVAPIPAARRWLHAFAVVEVEGAIFVQMQTFVGPQFGGHKALLKLAVLPPTGDEPETWGHWYVYDEVQPATGFAGTVEEAPIGARR